MPYKMNNTLLIVCCSLMFIFCFFGFIWTFQTPQQHDQQNGFSTNLENVTDVPVEDMSIKESLRVLKREFIKEIPQKKEVSQQDIAKLKEIFIRHGFGTYIK